MRSAGRRKQKTSIIIIGAGKVGIALGSLLQKKDYEITGAVSRSSKSLKDIARYLPGVQSLSIDDNESIKTTASSSDIILITTQDQEIQRACKQLADISAISKSHTVIHTSGAVGLSALDAASNAGASVASIHPIQSFANIDLAIEKIAKSFFGITLDNASREKTLPIVLEIIDDLYGTAIEVKDENKAIYHAASCVASNYLVSLLDLACNLYEKAGIPKETSINAMMPLVEGTLSNIKELGTVNALTGPIARGDVSTLARHIEELEGLDDPESLVAYQILGRLTTDIAIRKGSIDKETAAKILSLLDKTNNTV
jgi:predicted short-subunit dehydrogenase-like oxidoreductase (DUF2520 family)